MLVKCSIVWIGYITERKILSEFVPYVAPKALSCIHAIIVSLADMIIESIMKLAPAIRILEIWLSSFVLLI